MKKFKQIKTNSSNQRGVFSTSPQKQKNYQNLIKQTLANAQIQRQSLQKKYLSDLQQRDKIIGTLKLENEGLNSQIIKLRRQIVRLSQQKQQLELKVRQKSKQYLSKIHQNFAILEIKNHLTHDFEKIVPFAKLAEDIKHLLSAKPSDKDPILQSINELQRSLKSVIDNKVQVQSIKQLNEIKDTLRKQRQKLQQSLSEKINLQIEVFHKQQDAFIKKQSEIMKQIPLGIKQIKQESKKRQQRYKLQIKLLEQRIVEIQKQNEQMMGCQNSIIQQLGKSLSHLKQVYNRQIEIPLINLRQQVQKQIRKIKNEFTNMNNNLTINTIIKQLISTVNRYSESKSNSNFVEMQEQIRKIGNKLNTLNDYSTTTINQLRQLISKTDKRTYNTNFIQKSSQKIQLFSIKKKQKQQLQLQMKYYKQKQYILILQKYNKKLQQSVMRTVKTASDNSIFEEWKLIQSNYRDKSTELQQRMQKLEKSLQIGIQQTIQIKKTAIFILQTQNSLFNLFQKFQMEIISIQSFKDQLFNFLESQLKFKEQIHHQVQIFNLVFVQQYSKLSELQSKIPQPSALIDPIQPLSLQAYLDKSQNFNRFKNDYLAIFRQRSSSDSYFLKYLNLIGQMHEQLCKMNKNKQKKIIFQMNIQPLKLTLNNSILKVQDLLVNTKIIRDAILKNMEGIKHTLNANTQQSKTIIKSIKQSRFKNVVNTILEVFQNKRITIGKVEKYLQYINQTQNQDNKVSIYPVSF